MPSTNRYASAHLAPKGPGDARPTALQIVQDEGLAGKLTGKVVLVTGGSSGIGIETIRAMTKTGATVFAAARDLNKAKDALKGIDGKIELLELDLASLASVRAAAADFLKRSNGQLNILINNAGVMGIPNRTVTVDGFETQFGTNHLGHFLLFQLLKSALLSSATPELPSRVIALTSAVHKHSPVLVDDYNLEKEGAYNEFVAYGHSKTANIYMANAIERKYGAQGLHGLAVHPGLIATTGLGRHMDPNSWENAKIDNPHLEDVLKSPEQGAATSVYAAIGKEFEGVGGKFLEDVGEWDPAPEGAPPLRTGGWAPWAFDPEMEERVWNDSLKFVGL
ncbi:hypothetical protein B0J11DRAFT_480402 [Dendryphion nanum]|uniref:Uncharacterized protein n=1 Tax=Dendryphion nanum TaxID=256645 RepID=A0A9P9EEE7_9PLEO|nr:hypothetical protein B0J11DRAFT_480402 [Dendryphion nanum]